MRKTVWSLVVIGLTAVLLLMAMQKEHIAEAEIVRVERADVHRVIPIFGQLVYADEHIVTAVTPGIAEHVYVMAGERIQENAAMIRIKAPNADDSLSVYSALIDEERIGTLMENEKYRINRVVRSEKACTVRQVYVEEGVMLAAGMPLFRVSSHLQRVLCSVSPKDAEQIRPGMWAWLTTEGERLCLASVESLGERKADPMTGLEVQEVVLVPEKEIEMPEYSVLDADVYLAGSDDVLSLPLQAITARDTVWWVDDERCTEIPAQVVLHDEMRAWVQLPEGLTVAIGEFVEGQRVKEVQP